MIETTEELRVPHAPPIAGLRFRRYAGPSDVPEMVRVNLATREGCEVARKGRDQRICRELGWP